MDITRLPGKWLNQADSLPPGNSTRPVLKKCAEELQLAYHQHAHDGAFEPGCRFCDWEREHNDNYPEPG